MNDSDRPKAAARGRSRAGCPRTRGRKIASSNSAEKPALNQTVPRGPMCAKRCFAIAALSCVETTATTTSAGDGTAPSTGVRRVAADLLTAVRGYLGGLLRQHGDDPPAAARREVHAPRTGGEDGVVSAEPGAV